MSAAPAMIIARRPFRVDAGMRSRMKSFAVGQSVFLLNDRDITPGHLRRGAVGRVILLDGQRAWVEFPLGAIDHKELLTVGEVGWLSPCTSCRGFRTHRAGCQLDMSAPAMNPGPHAAVADKAAGL